MGNENSGRRPIRALFEEFNHVNPEIEPVYKMSDWHETFIRLRDPTEVLPAMELCGSWEAWQLMKRDWISFSRMVDEWQVELQELLTAEAFQKILALTESKTASVALSASKYIADNEFGRKKGAGRPSKAAEKRAADAVVRKQMDTKEDWERIQAVTLPAEVN